MASEKVRYVTWDSPGMLLLTGSVVSSDFNNPDCNSSTRASSEFNLKKKVVDSVSVLSQYWTLAASKSMAVI